MANGTTHTLTQIPPGVQCFVGDEARQRRRIEERVASIFEGWDYEEIIPPLFDYADVFSGAALASRTYSFVGRDGSLLALRPDFTSLLAKISAGRLANRPAPLRLYYSGEVLRYEPPKAGRQSELFQMGCELLGGERVAGDAEVLTIAAESLETAGVRDFVLALGHVGVFAGLVETLGLPATTLETLRERIEGKSPEGVRDVLAGAGVAAAAAEQLVRLTTLAGDAAVLDEARRVFASSPATLLALDELASVVRALDQAGLGPHLAIDLGEVRGFDYYTGLVFRAYAPGLGFEVGAGGRYDELLARFGRPLPAVGFMLGLDRLVLLLERQGNRTEPIAPPEVETVAGDELGARLRRARLSRARGRRVRIVNGGAA
jgi:ATP phosphoribosyltransferase regulatory subunit